MILFDIDVPKSNQNNFCYKKLSFLDVFLSIYQNFLESYHLYSISNISVKTQSILTKVGSFWNLQDKQILKLSLDLHLEQHLKEILKFFNWCRCCLPPLYLQLAEVETLSNDILFSLQYCGKNPLPLKQTLRHPLKQQSDLDPKQESLTPISLHSSSSGWPRGRGWHCSGGGRRGTSGHFLGYSSWQHIPNSPANSPDWSRHGWKHYDYINIALCKSGKMNQVPSI